jgi:hypothetical protein
VSEFVECQNCGRKFFAENIECPYCRDEQVDWERAFEEGGHEPGGIYRFLFAGFGVVLVLVVILALAALRRTPLGPAWWMLVLQAGLAATDAVGLWRRRHWARQLAIAFILGNAALGLLALWQRGQAGVLVWGPGPLVLLIFLVPFFSPQARERFNR